MKLRIVKKLILLSLVGALGTSLFGCNQPENADEPTEEAADNNPGDVTNNDTPDNNTPANENAPEPQAPNTQQIPGRSPVAITRVDPDDNKTPDIDPTNPDATSPIEQAVSAATNDEPEEPGKRKHDPLPNLFPVDECQIEVNGIYNPTLSKEIVTEINAARAEYMIDAMTLNTSLMACADVRCKEQYYFTGHFRPNGLPWYSVSPKNVQAELISIDYRTAPEIVEAWLSVNKTRVQLMNPEFEQIGVSVYDIDGIYYVAAMFGYGKGEDPDSSSSATVVR